MQLLIYFPVYLVHWAEIPKVCSSDRVRYFLAFPDKCERNATTGKALGMPRCRFILRKKNDDGHDDHHVDEDGPEP